MTVRQKGDLFFARKPSPHHKAPIMASGASTEFDSLYAYTFDHQVVDEFMPAHYYSDGSLTHEKVTHMFHTEYFKPTIHLGMDGGAGVSVDDLYNSVSASPITADTKRSGRLGPNRLSALIGRIGVGKTTLLSHIQVRFRSQMIRDKIWPIRIDVETMAGRNVDRLQFFKELYMKIFNAASNRKNLLPDEELQEIFHSGAPGHLTNDNDLDSQLFAMATKRFIVEIHERTGIRILLFLDNIDKYYYLFDRGAYSAEGDRRRQASCEKLAGIISAFDSPNGWLDGAGLCVLVCLRRHTLEYVIAARYALPGRYFSWEGSQNIFHMIYPDPNQVVTSRLDLLSSCLKLLTDNANRRAVAARVDYLRSVWTSNVRGVPKDRQEALPVHLSMVQDLAQISHHGYRSLIEHFSKYRWCMGDDVIARRFFKTYAPAILTFMLRDLTRYSQSESRFPNMFLVRGDAEMNYEDTVPKGLLNPHRHTYWLKYLIAKLVAMGEDRGLAVTPSSILDVFCPNDNGNACYERHIVELVMGSLQQVDVSAVTEPVFTNNFANTSLSVKDIKLTPRGKFIMDAFAFDFIYLQLIVEDYLMELPEPWLSDFGYMKLDYSYLIAKNADYQAAIKDMISIKARQVFLFIEILDASLTSEAKRYPIVFEAMTARKIDLPDFRKIRRNNITRLKQIGRAMNDPKVEDIALTASQNAENRRPAIVTWFEHAYVKYNI